MDWTLTGMSTSLVFLAAVGFLAVRHAIALKRSAEAIGEELLSLRDQCMSIVMSRPASTSVDNKGRVANQHSIEHLRLYVRYLDRFDTVDLDRVISVLNTARSKRLTILTSDEWTDEHMDIYQQFKQVTTTLDLTKPNLILIKPTMYSIHHPEDMPLVLSIVRDRGIRDMNEIGPLLREMKSSGSKSLAEGML